MSCSPVIVLLRNILVTLAMCGYLMGSNNHAELEGSIEGLFLVINNIFLICK